MRTDQGPRRSPACRTPEARPSRRPATARESGTSRPSFYSASFPSRAPFSVLSIGLARRRKERFFPQGGEGQTNQDVRLFGRPSPWTTVARLACMAAVFAAASRPASGRAEEPAPITLVDPETLPFSSAEMTQALLARLFPADDGADPPGFRIAPAGAGTVTVQIGDRSRVVAIGDRSGPAAARVIALVIAELLSGAGAEAAPDEGAAAPAAPTATVLRAASEPPGRFDGTAAAAPADHGVVRRLS